MKSIQTKLEENYLLGCIKYKSQYNFYLMPIAWWILNYKKYDPEHSKENDYNFRNNIFIVNDENVDIFFESIKEDNITELQLENIIQVISKENPDENYQYLNFFIDFDTKKIVNGFYDIEMEDYLPDNTWSGVFGEPVKHLPSYLQRIWIVAKV